MLLRILFSTMVVLGLINLKTEAASISVTIVLTDMGGVELPHVGNTYGLLPGQQFKVQVQGVVNNPNITDTLRAGTAMDNKPLGVANVVGVLATSSVNAVNPVGNNDAPPKWQGFVEYIGLGVPGFVNLLDAGSDGDLDPSGAGVANSSTSLANALFLSTFQLGATGLTPFFEGDYVNSGFGITQLTFTPTTAQVFTDPAGGDNNAVAVENVINTFTSNTVIIGLPEPSTYALAGLGLLCLGATYRRSKATSSAV